MTGWKDWQIGEVVTESDFQNLVQDQVIQRYADSTERTSTLGTAVAEGMVSYLEDTNKVEVYDGTAWTDFSGDISAVTAGSGLTGGGTAGSVTLSADYAAIGSAITVDQDQVTGLTTGTAGYTALSNGTAGITYQPVSHNYIINGAFDVWQRGTSFASLSTFGNFTADRWRYNTGTATATVSQQSFTAGDLEVTGFGDARFYLRCNFDTAGNQFQGMQNLIEDVKTLSGQTVTVSFWAKGDVARDVLVQITQNFGSGGSSSTGTSGGVVGITTSWQRYSATFTLTSVDTKTIGTGSYLQVAISNQEQATGYIDLWGVQLEAGSVATPFKRHAPSLQGELAACQRYYYRLTPGAQDRPFGPGQAALTTAAIAYIPFPVAMRVRPTALEQSGTASDYYVTLANANRQTLSAVPTFNNATTDGAYVSCTTSGSLVSGNATAFSANTSSGYLGWSAEL